MAALPEVPQGESTTELLSLPTSRFAGLEVVPLTPDKRARFTANNWNVITLRDPNQEADKSLQGLICQSGIDVIAIDLDPTHPYAIVTDPFQQAAIIESQNVDIFQRAFFNGIDIEHALDDLLNAPRVKDDNWTSKNDLRIQSDWYQLHRLVNDTLTNNQPDSNIDEITLTTLQEVQAILNGDEEHRLAYLIPPIHPANLYIVESREGKLLFGATDKSMIVNVLAEKNLTIDITNRDEVVTRVVVEDGQVIFPRLVDGNFEDNEFVNPALEQLLQERLVQLGEVLGRFDSPTATSALRTGIKTQLESTIPFINRPELPPSQDRHNRVNLLVDLLKQDVTEVNMTGSQVREDGVSAYALTIGADKLEKPLNVTIQFGSHDRKSKLPITTVWLEEEGSEFVMNIFNSNYIILSGTGILGLNAREQVTRFLNNLLAKVSEYTVGANPITSTARYALITLRNALSIDMPENTNLDKEAEAFLAQQAEALRRDRISDRKTQHIEPPTMTTLLRYPGWGRGRWGTQEAGQGFRWY